MGCGNYSDYNEAEVHSDEQKALAAKKVLAVAGFKVGDKVQLLRRTGAIGTVVQVNPDHGDLTVEYIRTTTDSVLVRPIDLVVIPQDPEPERLAPVTAS